METGHTYVGECYIGTGGSCSTSLVAPSSAGSFSHMVGVDKTGNGDFDEAGEKDTETLSVTSACGDAHTGVWPATCSGICPAAGKTCARQSSCGGTCMNNPCATSCGGPDDVNGCVCS